MKNLQTLVVSLSLLITSGFALADTKSDKEREDVISYSFRYGVGAAYLSDLDASVKQVYMETIKMKEPAQIIGLKKELADFAKAALRFDAQVKAYRANLLKECLKETPKSLHDLCVRDLKKQKATQK